MAFIVKPIVRGVVKGASVGMGLVGEKYYDRKERKAALSEQESSTEKNQIDELLLSSGGDDLATDERIWALDEAAGPPPNYEESEKEHRPDMDRTISDLVQDTMYMGDGQQITHPEQQARLPYPVIIPQRRPGKKARGFARAYPPTLEAFNIDQDTFMRFLQNFDDASQASPWLNAVFIGAGVVGFIPNHITMAVSISVQFAAGTAIELQSRYKANAFLDQMNRDVFMPLGLYCMVLMCKDGPGSAENPYFGMETVNLDNAKNISKWGLPKEKEDDEIDISKSKQILRPIRLVSGKTPVSNMPLEIAPLVYPGLEDMITRPTVKRDESFKERLMRNKDFVADYYDRRAQAEYTGNNPDSALTKASSETPQFRTRFADPNHPCNNGHLVSLVTGGKIVAKARGRRNDGYLREVGPDGKLLPRSKEKPKIRGPISLVSHGVRKVLSPNILYLTIVNLPSEEELAEAKQLLESSK